MPVDKLPLDVFIANQVSYQRKKEKDGQLATNENLGKSLTQREEAEILAQSQGLMLIPEYQFEHCIYPLD